jgi:hypothetical protein
MFDEAKSLNSAINMGTIIMIQQHTAMSSAETVGSTG